MTASSSGTTIGVMAFIRAKVCRGRTYYYLVESRRDGKKVRQKVLKYLGTKAPEGWHPKKSKEDK